MKSRKVEGKERVRSTGRKQTVPLLWLRSFSLFLGRCVHDREMEGRGKTGMLGSLAIGKGSKAAAEIFTGKKRVSALVR